MNKKKIFKKIISIFLAFIILSCALVPIAAKAETVSDANFTRYFPFTGLYNLSGYAYYNSSIMSRVVDSEYPANNDFGAVDISELVSNQYYLNFVASLDDYVSLEQSFDMYVDIWSFDNGAGGFYVKPCIILVKKGSTICMKNPHQDGYVRVYNHQIYSDSPYIFACPINQAQNTNTCFSFWQKGSYGQNTVGTTTINGVEYTRLSLYVNKDHPFLFTNIPYFENEDAIANYLGSGDASGALNANKGYAPPKEGCDSFYFDNFDCTLTRIGHTAEFYATYSYDSCNKIKYSPEDYQLALYFTLNVKYKKQNNIYQELSSSSDWLYYDLYPNRLKSTKIIGSEIDFRIPLDGSHYPLLALEKAVDVVNKLRGGNGSFDILEVVSCNIYLTAGLVKKGSNAGPSSQNFFYSWDFETLTKRDLTPDLNVITNGDGTDKKVTQIVGNDGGNTVINISVNVQGGDGGDGGSGGDGGDGGSGGDGGDGGSGGDGGDGGSSGGGGSVTKPDAGTENDTQSKSFWSILKGFVKFLAGLIDDNDGLFPVIAAYFTFIPAEFWTCLIGVIVVIAVISIYKLLKS